MNVITTWSESGGVGKTTTALNLAAALGRAGCRTLVVDLDPQPASVTDYAGYASLKTDDREPTLDELLLDGSDGGSLADLVVEGDHYDLVPAHEDLANLESTVRSQGVLAGEFLLRDALSTLEGRYDVAIVDPPATLNLLVDNALIASDAVLVPMEMTHKGRRSVTGVVETVTALESQLQRAEPEFDLDVVGVLPNKVSGSALNERVRNDLAESETLARHDVGVLPIEVPEYNVLESTWEAHLDVFAYAERPEYGLRAYQESLLDAYADLAAHLIDRQDLPVTTATGGEVTV